jgi:hypothetical protein
MLRFGVFVLVFLAVTSIFRTTNVLLFDDFAAFGQNAEIGAWI